MYNQLITKLKEELATKDSPGPILDGLMFGYLESFGKKIEAKQAINWELLYLGAILGDIKIDEARAAGDISKHVEMAVEYAKTVIEENEIPADHAVVILEMIESHHGGKQIFVESKIYKNADNFKFLDPIGCMHFFGTVYEPGSVASFEEARNTVKAKLDEKLELTDLDEQTIEIAKKLYKMNINYLFWGQ